MRKLTIFKRVLAFTLTVVMVLSPLILQGLGENFIAWAQYSDTEDVSIMEDISDGFDRYSYNLSESSDQVVEPESEPEADSEDLGINTCESVAGPEAPVAAEVQSISESAPQRRGAGETVRIRETGELFFELEDAVAAASGDGDWTLEVIGDMSVPRTVNITSNITLVAAEGEHIVTMGSKRMLVVTDGGNLILGDGTWDNNLTISASTTVVSVNNGTIYAYDGVTLKNSNTDVHEAGLAALSFSGVNTRGAIHGGRFEGHDALRVANGARLIEISGGEFLGRQSAAYITDAGGHGTRVDRITGGTFIKTDQNVDRACVYFENGARGGEISGGTFIGGELTAILIIRGSWIEEISGGEFQSLDGANMAAVMVKCDGFGLTGIGTVSGGDFRGAILESGPVIGLGLWIHGPQGRVYSITDGTFVAERALQIEPGSVVESIAGGTFTGTSRGTRQSIGVFNAGRIGEIGGPVNISGRDAGIWNFTNGRIDEIKDGRISATGTSGPAVINAGTIDRISSGTFIGGFNAISNTGVNRGTLNVITGGVYWARFSNTISLAYPLLLEPGLTGNQGIGRYRAGNPNIFNNDELVIYPDGYHMSTRTEHVEGITAVEFRYLTRYPGDITVTFDGNGGVFEDDLTLVDCIIPAPANTLGTDNMPDNPERIGYTFVEWNTERDGSYDVFTADTKVTGDITVYAQWEPKPTFTVTFMMNDGTDGEYWRVSGFFAKESVGEKMPEDPSRDGYIFTRWSEVRDCDGEESSFTKDVPIERDITVYAQWEPKPTFTVTFMMNDGTDSEYWRVSGFFARETVGEKMPEDPSRDGYIFTRWSEVRDYDGEESSFTKDVPIERDITVYAQWTPKPTFTVTFMMNDGTDAEYWRVSGFFAKESVGEKMPEDPSRDGYIFTRWSEVRDCDEEESSFTKDVPIERDITVYAQWTPISGGGSSGGGSSGGGTVTYTPDIEVPLVGLPFINDHIAYIIGYPEGYVRPGRNITRAEVATVFFRLLTDDVRAEHWTRSNSYPDVHSADWYNNAVSVMSNMGIVNGYPDETFRPNDAITRGELAAISARFARARDMLPVNIANFSDAAGHWAESDILYAASVGWVRGYPDGTFSPNQSITRAEFMTLVNRMLERVPELPDDLLLEQMIVWRDNADTNAWYYIAVQEATNSHVPVYKSGKYVPGSVFEYEYWVSMLENPNWLQLEKEWAEHLEQMTVDA